MISAMRTLTRWAREEWLCWLSLGGLLASSLALRRVPHYTPDDFQVVFLLLGFLVIVKGLEKGHLLSRLAATLGTGGRLPLRLVLITGLLAPFITNDVALLVMVPLTLALDLEEEFRPLVVDRLVLDLINDQKLVARHFTKPQGKKRAVYLSDEGRPIFVTAYESLVNSTIVYPLTGKQNTYRRCFELQARQVARIVLGKAKKYRALVVK